MNDMQEVRSALDAHHAATITAVDAITRRLKNVEDQLDEMCKREARRRLADAVGGGGAGGASSEEVRAANAALRAFIRSGNPAELRSMVGSSGPDGGYLIYPEISSTINQVLRSTSPIRNYARVVNISVGDAWEEPIDRTGLGAEWVGETSPREDTATPSLGVVSIGLWEIYAAPKVSQRLLDDSSYDLAGWLATAAGEAFSRKQNTAFVSGDGVNCPRGFATYPTVATADATRAWGSFQHVATGVSGNFAASDPADKLIELQYTLKAEYLPEAVWMMNRLTASRIRQFKDQHGRYLWENALTPGQPPMLLGHPVVLAEDMPAIGANSLAIAFGNLRRAYTIVDRPGLKLLTDPYSAKPNVIFYSYQRVGGNVVDFHALKFLKFGTS